GGDDSTDDATDAGDDAAEATDTSAGDADEDAEPGQRTSSRGGRGRGRGDRSDKGEKTDPSDKGDGEKDDDSAEGEDADSGDEGGSSSSRRRRRRRRSGDSSGGANDDPENTVTKVRQGRSIEDEITAVSGSTRLEAKKQRRREGREAGRRRAPIASEAEFLARREAVERVMVVRQKEELTQIAVLEDKVLVEHYVARESQTSLIGNVYVGRVQNVLPSMEAAFIDIGKGRNAVLYAGEVNWSSLGHKEGQPRKIESVLSSGQTVLVQVTKDPVGHKGARLTSQVSLAGRFLVYVPDGTTSGISRKLPDTERARLKTLLKEIVPASAGVIVRTAAEGASEDELTRDVERLKARWEDIEAKASGKGGAPQLLYGEPDLTLKVVRDLFTEDFSKLVVEGDEAWETVSSYVQHVAPDLAERLEQHVPDPTANISKDVFERYRIDEQIAKGLDRKVWLPSGGSLIIDRTEAMTVVDVNTGKFTGSGGNLEETVTKNNLEAAEEMVRQLRLRDIGGIIVIDFIDMVLENNRDLVLRRLVECLGRDRTRHQVAEVTSLGLVQMTRKRIGTGLVEAFSENCSHCQGRGIVLHDHPIEPKGGGNDNRGGGNNRGNGDNGGGDGDGERRSGRRRGRGRGGDGDKSSTPTPTPTPAVKPNPAEIAAVARIAAASAHAPAAPADEQPADEPTTEQPTTEQPTTEPTVDVEPVASEPVASEPEAEPAAPVVRSVQRTTRTATVVPTREAVVLTVDPTAEPAAPVAPTAPAPAVTVVTRTRQRAVPPAAPRED
ncbi:MAG TPA: Rne/Rng family ribonuclease, partial [Nocardioides sp.]